MFTSSMKCFRLAILLVLFTFPLGSYELGVRSGDEASSLVDEGRALRSKPPRKFEFRKLVRTIPSDEEESGGDDEEETEEEDDTDDTEDGTKFQWVRKADGSKLKSMKKHAIVDKYGEDYEQEETEPVTKEKEKVRDKDKSPRKDKETGGGFFSSFFGGFFGGKEATPVRPAPPPRAVEKSNGIIDWIQSLSRSFKKPVEEPKPSGADWKSYFNRWPFNSFFPIGKPEKKITLPSGESSSSRYSSSHGAEPMSQEHFESLLHTVPGFVVNASLVSDIECKQQMQIFHRQLRGNKFWTLQMLDSTGKITSGMLRGNINQLGDFEMCTNAKTVVKVTSDISMRIRGKYCLASIETQPKVEELKVAVHLAQGRGLWRSHLGNPSHFVPRYAVANWGVCIPNACSASVVQDMIERNLGPYNNTGVEFRVEVTENDCHVRTSRKFAKLLKKDQKFSIAICYFAAFWIISTAACISENWSKISAIFNSFLKSSNEEPPEEPVKEEVEEPTEAEETDRITDQPPIFKEVFHSFSPKRSLSELVSRDRLDMQFPIFHLFKITATFMLYVCLKYIMIGHLPITNRDKLVRTMDQPLSVVFRSPLIYTDLLLIISGFLSAYQLSEEMEQKTYIGVIKRVFAKILRYLPTIYAVLFFQTWILPHLGTGPLWNKLIGQNARLCEQNMWRVLFGVQNAIDFEETCSPITIQLALELQLYMVGPLIVWLYYTDSDAGFFAYGLLQAMSVAARFSRTNLEHLSAIMFHGMNVSKFYRTANILFSSPISRATPYLIGIGAGILYRSTDGNLEIPPGLTNIGWLTTIVSIAWCFWYPSSGMRSDFIYNSSEAASYAAWSPLILGLAMIWIVFMTAREGNVFSDLLTTKPILFLSRISFPMQLVSFVVVMYTTAGVKESSKYHINDLVNVAELATIVLYSTFLAFLIDVPFQNIRQIIIKKLFTEKSTLQEDSHYDGDGDQIEESSEVADSGANQVSKLDNIEETTGDDVWEEEHEYVVRLDSHLANGRGAVIESSISEQKPKPESEPEPDQESEPASLASNQSPGEDETETEEDEEEEIAEEDEVIRRPATPERPSPPPYRRRRPTTEDDD